MKWARISASRPMESRQQSARGSPWTSNVSGFQGYIHIYIYRRPRVKIYTYVCLARAFVESPCVFKKKKRPSLRLVLFVFSFFFFF